MNRFDNLSRILLGVTFVVFGLDGVLHFFPLPPMPGRALAVIETLRGYGLFYLVKAIEVGSGLLLLRGRRVTLAALLLAPIVVNIVWFDAALDPSSLPVGLLVAALEARLLWSARGLLRPLAASRVATPA